MARVPVLTRGDFGSIRVRVGGTDITTFRDTPITVTGWGSLDPGGHDATTIGLPQVHLGELGDLGTGDLRWYYDGAVVLIDQVQAGSVVGNLWRGRIRAVNTTDSRISLECDGDMVGPMSWALYRPSLDRQVDDIGHAIAKQIPLSSHVEIRPALPDTGIEMERTGSRSDTRWGWALSALALAQTQGGVQWTLLPDAGEAGVYRIVERDLTSHDLTVYLGMPGVTADLLHDITATPTRWYGEGQRSDGGRWYGSVYPYLGAAPVVDFPNTDGRDIELGDTNADTDSGDGILVLIRALGRFGSISWDDIGDQFNRNVLGAVKDLQENAGLPVTGDVDEATWAVMFADDGANHSLLGAHYEPLITKPSARAFNRSPSGFVIGRNPNYDPKTPIVDAFTQFGTGVDKTFGRDWSRAQMQRDFDQPDWVGTVVLTTDPAQMSRFNVRAGMNLWDPTFGDGGAVFHIASVAVDWQGGSVACAVSTRGRDYLDVATILDRNRTARANPAKRFAAQLSRQSAMSHDMLPGWDFEGGAGIVNDVDCPAGEWTVVPVFVGQSGSVGSMNFRTNAPTEYAIAIFARKVTPNHLNALVPEPLAERAEDGSWDTDPDVVGEVHGVEVGAPGPDMHYALSGRLADARLLVYAAGTPTTPSDAPMPCGYYPNVNAGKPDNDSIGTNLTGRWQDDASFEYWTYGSPFLYVAVWPRETTTFKGRLFPSFLDGGM